MGDPDFDIDHLVSGVLPHPHLATILVQIDERLGGIGQVVEPITFGLPSAGLLSQADDGVHFGSGVDGGATVQRRGRDRGRDCDGTSGTSADLGQSLPAGERAGHDDTSAAWIKRTLAQGTANVR